MDTITQALLGAACGNACARHKLGKRAAFWGAIGGALPDLDTASALGGPWVSMVHHRGVTHALWFGPVVGSLIGWLLWKRFARLRARDPDHENAALGSEDKRRWWMLLLAVAILSHPLLDLFTTYGTQLLAPFSRERFAVNAIGIIDPLYSVPLAVVLLWGRRAKEQLRDGKKMRAARVGLVATTAYLFYGLWLNHRAEELARASLAEQGITATVRAYPRVLQIFQRRLFARDGDVLYSGQVSMFAPRPIVWHRFVAASGPLVDATRATREGQLFEWFAVGQTAARVERRGDVDVVEIDDMRYLSAETPELSMWAIRAEFKDGELLAPIVRFRRPIAGGTSAALSRMWRDTFSPD